MTFFLICAILFGESKTLATQIRLDQAGFSCNTIDGNWGAKSQRALERYCAQKKVPVPKCAEDAYDILFANDETELFKIEIVSQADIDSIVKIPNDAAEKAKLTQMGYESIGEMFAERGHLSLRAMERLNPGVNWKQIEVGTKLVIPNFPSYKLEIAAGNRGTRQQLKRPLAAVIKIHLSRFEICAYDANNICIASFPCSIARDKTKVPPHGELKITAYIANPNYTYTPDYTPKGKKVARYIFPSGPNCPVGVVWMGLNLPSYGIHGTPKPESIGTAESHGCFRLANWNAARLYALCKSGTRVIIEP